MTPTSFKRYRQAAGFSQRLLADALGFSGSSRGQIVSNWERGMAAIPRKYAKPLQFLLGLPADYVDNYYWFYQIRRKRHQWELDSDV